MQTNNSIHARGAASPPEAFPLDPKHRGRALPDTIDADRLTRAVHLDVHRLGVDRYRVSGGRLRILVALRALVSADG